MTFTPGAQILMVVGIIFWMVAVLDRLIAIARNTKR